MTTHVLSDVQLAQLQHSPLGLELRDIFESESIQTFFQPIVCLKQKKVFAFEALTRGLVNSPLYSPVNLFNFATEQGCLMPMDLMARRVAIKSFKQAMTGQTMSVHLFLNVSVSTILNEEHPSGITLAFLKEFGVDPQQVVIEITELQPVEDSAQFLKAIHHYRQMGFKVAIDDLGSGYNGLKLWSEVKPDYVKIDRHFITEIDQQADKYRFMQTILTLANSLGTKVIAEGVETESELRILKKLGVDYVQGFLLKKPSPIIDSVLDYQWKDSLNVTLSEDETIACLCEPVLSMPLSTRVNEMAEVFLQYPKRTFIPIVEKGQVLGMVWRRELMDLLARKFGRELHHRKEIGKVMDRTPFVFEAGTSLVEASREITRDTSYDKGAFIVVKEGVYHGCGLFMELLELMTDLKVRSAQYANPLSGLPGNVPIQQTLQMYLDRKRPFTVIYVDVDHFKAYNDYYSFEQGDQVISVIAEVLKSTLNDSRGFIGHIGGDDFVMILETLDYQTVCETVLDKFQSARAPFYTQEDRDQGGIQGRGRDDEPRFFPMMTLSLGVLLVDTREFEHTQKLASLATKAKKGAKQQGGDTYYVVDSRVIPTAQ